MNNTTRPNRNTPNTVPISQSVILLALGTAMLGLLWWAQAAQAAAGPRILEVLEIERVWAGHRVGFCLLTHGDHQFAAYYDAERRMTVAGRKLGEER